jgi:hypothetical protein
MSQDELDDYILLLLIYGMLDGFELDFGIDGDSINEALTMQMEASEEISFEDDMF